MTNDPIMDEVRRVRREYEAECHYNVRSMAEDLRRRRQQYADRLISYPPKPVQRKNTA